MRYNRKGSWNEKTHGLFSWKFAEKNKGSIQEEQRDMDKNMGSAQELMNDAAIKKAYLGE